MRLTLRLDSSATGAVTRHPMIRATRVGPSVSRAEAIVWHDTPSFDLAAVGLAVSESTGVWRLERHRPVGDAPDETGPWPAAPDHRVLAEAQDVASLDIAPLALPSLAEDTPPAPVASFEGRRTAVPLRVDGAAVDLTLLRGILRTPEGEFPAARLTLDGPDAAVTHLARALTAVLPLSVPRHGLAMEGIALAGGEARIPVPSGVPVPPAEGGATPDAFTHIVGTLTTSLIALAPAAASPDGGVESVHRMRVAVRRLRSALALFRPLVTSPLFEPAAFGLRSLGHVLGPARDWDVFLTETLPPVEDALPGRRELSNLRKAGARRQSDARAALTAWLEGPAFRALMVDLACLAAAPAMIDPPPLADFAAEVLSARWRKLTKAAKRMKQLDDVAMHDVRLKTKRLRYAAEFFAPLFPGRDARRFLRGLTHSQDRLGIYNDTATADALSRALSTRPGHGAGLVLGFAAARASGIRPKITRSWSRLKRRDPFWS
jgi:CHAD domain-containing protein